MEILLLNRRGTAEFAGIRHRVAHTGPNICRLGPRLTRHRKCDRAPWINSFLPNSERSPPLRSYALVDDAAQGHSASPEVSTHGGCA
jgi:hypothetical protein